MNKGIATLLPDSPDIWHSIELKLLYLSWAAYPILLVLHLHSTGSMDLKGGIMIAALVLSAVEARNLSTGDRRTPAGTAMLCCSFVLLAFSPWNTSTAVAAWWPVLTFHTFIRYRPMVASAAALASLAVMAGAVLLQGTGSIAQISRAFFLGAMFLAIFMLAFSRLRRTLKELDETKQLLHNSIHSLVYGAMLIDDKGVVRVFNHLVVDMLDLPPDLITIGSPEITLMTFLQERGDLKPGSVVSMHLFDRERRSISLGVHGETDKEAWLAKLGRGDVFGYYIRRNLKGRYIEIKVAPALGGGYIRTFEDVTEKQLITQQLHSVINDLHVMRKQDLTRSREQIVQALSKLARYRDEETGDHIVRTQLYIRALTEGLLSLNYYTSTLTEPFIETTVKAAPMHDLGKIGIPDAILKKPGRLTDEEMQVMRTHALIGENTLLALCNPKEDAKSLLSIAARIAGGHHENWDGSGYPRKLTGQEIPLEARLMALADNYDALTTSRIYKTAWTHEDTAEEIRKLSGKKFDPCLVEAFFQQEDNFKAIALRFKVDEGASAH